MKKSFLIPGILLCTGFLGPPATGQDQAAAKQETAAIEPAAQELLTRMAESLARAERLSVNYRAGYDVVQESGQKIQYGERRAMILSRPDHLRTEAELSGGGKRLVVFDGKTISVLNSDENVYAQVEKPGSVDEAIRYLVGDLRVRLPLARMFVTSLPGDLEQRLQSLAFVENDALSDVATAHLAGRTEDVDFQIWIPSEGEPLPRRIVITYKGVAGEPQFWAVFTNWDLKPDVAGSQFAFSPPAGAEQIPFLVRVRKQDATAAVNKGEQK